jgi:carbon-monoxide dehydrogenase small subunit
MTRQSVTLTVNGRAVTCVVEPRLSLADLLRHEVRLTGTHLGCEHGVCGACTVLVDGVSVRSCLMFAVQAEGSEITTIEGLAKSDGTLHPIQQAFRDAHALQCGFCTPGMMLTVMEFLRETPDPSEHEIRDAISGNICCCTGYQGIVEATMNAAKKINGGAR